jgi:oxygen-independent coproporphyrinogen-3 oxidase
MFNRLYIHVPFCLEKCQYCAFVSKTPENNELLEYPELLSRELQFHTKEARPLESIYFGGGTPSLLKPEQVARLLSEIAHHVPIRQDAEITLEANPGTVDLLALKAFHDAGVNRISLGVQSFDDRFLACLGRIHTAEQSRQAFQSARQAGFTNISIDLIHSLPGQSLDQWRIELQQALKLAPEHISIYGLTIETGTPFARRYPAESLELADEDLSADMFECADELLIGSGFDHYEIANYARPGFRSQHNSGYWRRDGYLGLGVAAHSFLRKGHGIRFCNPDTLREYRQEVLSGQPLLIGEQSLTEREAMAEYMFLGLRLADGVSRSAFEQEFGRSLDSVYGTAATELAKLELIVQTDELLALTRRGMLLSNQVFNRFL